jgi:hypothetical protein
MAMTLVRVASLALAGAAIAVWGGFVLLGLEGIKDIANQHAPGYPNWAQIIYYLGFPLLMFCVSLAWPVWRLRVGAQNLGIGVLSAVLAISPLYLLAYTGGV